MAGMKIHRRNGGDGYGDMEPSIGAPITDRLLFVAVVLLMIAIVWPVFTKVFEERHREDSNGGSLMTNYVNGVR